MIKTVQHTGNITNLSNEQFQALLSGDMSWEEAHEISPGAPLTVIEITEEEAENGDWLDDMETDDGEE